MLSVRQGGKLEVDGKSVHQCGWLYLTLFNCTLDNGGAGKTAWWLGALLALSEDEAPALGGSPTPVAPTPGSLPPSSGLLKHLHTCGIYPQTHTR